MTAAACLAPVPARPKPRIAFFLATSGHSGVDRIMQRLIPAIARRGYEVDLLGIEGHGPYLPEGEAGDVQQLSLGVRHVNFALLPLLRYLKRVRPDCLLSDKDRLNRLALTAGRLSGMRTRISVRLGTQVSLNGQHRGMLERGLQRLSMLRLYPQAHGVLVPSRGVAEDVAALAPGAATRIRVVPSPVVTDALLRQAQAPLDHPGFVSGGPPLILGVGELSARKDFGTLLQAFARVRARRPCRLAILGRGREEAALRDLAATLAISGDVLLPGFVENPYAWMARAAVFVSSSRWEGLGLALVEALALGCPVVATDCPSGPREVLAGGRYGPLVPVGDVEAMAAAIGRVLEAPLPAVFLKEAAEPYRLERSVTAYLHAMGVE